MIPLNLTYSCIETTCKSFVVVVVKSHTPQVLSKLKKYTKDPNFSADKMVQYSVACQSFCQWVLAIERYCQVYRVVQPKRELHWKISAELDAVVGRLQAKELQLNEVS